MARFSAISGRTTNRDGSTNRHLQVTRRFAISSLACLFALVALASISYATGATGSSSFTNLAAGEPTTANSTLHHQGSDSGGAATSDAGQHAEFAPDRLMVRFKASASAADRSEARSSVDATFAERLPVKGLQLLDLPDGSDVEVIADQLEEDPNVLYAEPDFLRTISATPNDAMFGQMWGLNNTGQLLVGATTGQSLRIAPSGTSDGYVPTLNGTPDADIDAPTAWDYTTGNTSVIVADIDSGIDFAHPDLIDNIYNNSGEVGLDGNNHDKRSNGVDDDLNGYVDDWHGWDFVAEDNNPSPVGPHGTHTAGTIAARGNNGIGVTGVNWTASLMPLNVFTTAGAYSSDLVQAYDYVADNGVRVVNGSYGGTGSSQAELDAIANASNTLFVFAAGNDGTNNDGQPFYPCNYPSANIICVAATNEDDGLAWFSNYGSSTVDIAAPGTNILSTVPLADTTYTADYAYFPGTSMAAPHVTGAATLLFAADPTSTVAEVKANLLGSTDPLPALNGKTATGGRLNVGRAVENATPPPVGTETVGISGSSLVVRAGTGQSNTISVTKGASDFSVVDTSTNLQPGAGCSSISASEVTCPSAGLAEVRVRAEDLDDSIVIVGDTKAEIFGGSGDDTLVGGDGDDILHPGTGSDSIGGGLGNDTADYSDRSDDLSLSMNGAADDGGAGENDSILSDIEGIKGGSGDDVVAGSANADTLDGGGGNDQIHGNAGNDTIRDSGGTNTLFGEADNDQIVGGPGADTLDGGTGTDSLNGAAGTDTVSYATRAASVAVSFDNVANDGESGENDSISNMQNIRGGSAADTLTGDTYANLIEGGAGGDIMSGGGGSGVDTVSYVDHTQSVLVDLTDAGPDGAVGEGDILTGFRNIIGGTGNDTLTGDTNANTLDGGTGGDLIDGRSGTDTVSYAPRTRAVSVSFNGLADDGEAGENDSLTAIEIVSGGSGNDNLLGDGANNTFNGGEGNDTILGGAGSDTLNGDAGADVINGEAGSDTINGGTGSDTIDGNADADIIDGGPSVESDNLAGGTGVDTVSYATRAASVDVSLDGTNNDGESGENDVLSGDFENIYGGLGDDKLTGDGANNRIDAKDGDDIVDGGLGADTMIGGAGFNTVTYAMRTNAVKIDARRTGFFFEPVVSGEAGESDSVDYNFQGLIGGSGNDTMYGNDSNYTSDTSASGVLIGGPGNDYMNGGSGPDSLDGQGGADTVIGDGAVAPAAGDTVAYDSRTAAVNVSQDGLANDGEAGEGDNVDADVETIRGGSGDDTLEGAGTNGQGVSVRSLVGNNGNDVLRGAAGAIVHEQFYGGAGDDSLQGSGGNDYLRGDAGADELVGGAGVDHVSYNDKTSGVTVDLEGDADDGVAGENDRVDTSIEDIIGSQYNDTLRGNDGVNEIQDGGGDDVVYAGGGDDLLTNETFGSDVLYGEAGDDFFAANDSVGANEGDEFNGGSGTDEVSYSNRFYQPVRVTIDGVANDGSWISSENDNVKEDVENITGSSLNGDQLTGSDGPNRINGTWGSDTLNGGGGDDVLIGGRSTDQGGFGNNDKLNGGDGNDVASFEDHDLAVTASLDGVNNDGSYIENIGQETDTIAADVEGLIGGKADDILIGNDAANSLSGMAGNDTISGLAGNDKLNGGLGTDTLNGDDDNDVLMSLDGAVDQANCGAGTDSAVRDSNDVPTDCESSDTTGGTASVTDGELAFSAGPGQANNLTVTQSGVFYIVTDNSAVYPQSGCVSVTANQVKCGGDYPAITKLRINTDDLSDAISVTGAASAVVDSGSGNDSVSTSDGDDTIDGGIGTDTLSAGAGSDTVSYASRSNPVTVTLNGVANDGEPGESDAVATDIENATGGSGADSITGSSSDNVLTGGAGNDTLIAGSGNDTLIGGTGSDVFTGDGGTDTVSYDYETVAVNASINATADDGRASEGDNIGSTVENIVGGPANDTLSGDAAANALSGGTGNDTIDGGAGSDSLAGGAGVDIVSYASHSTDVSVSFDSVANDGSSGENDILASDFENITGGSGNDTIVGDNLNNALNGGAGNDKLTGKYGSDQFAGGLGVDTVSYEYVAGGTQVNVSLITGSGSSSGESDTFGSDIENLYGSNLADYFTGGQIANRLEGTAGNDTLTGNGGNDTLIGGPGVDTHNAGDGDDMILSRDGTADTVSCGNGVDSVDADPIDTLTACETVVLGPDTTINAGPVDTSYTNDSTPTFGFVSSEAGSSFECKIDNGAWFACTSSYTLPTLGEGSHTFSVRAKDGYGNVDTTPATRAFTVDTVAPVVTISSPANGSTTSNPSPAVAFSVTELSPHTELCKVDAAAFAACPSALAALALGSHTLTVQSTDAAGNVGTAASVFTVINPPLLSATALTSPSATHSFTSEGTADWSHWGTTAATTWDHKATGGGQISNVTPFGGTTLTRVTSSVTPTVSWTDGTTGTGQTASTTGTASGVLNTTSGVGRGFSLTVPNVTNSEAMTLKLYVGLMNCQGKLELYWSSNPSVIVSDTSISTTSTFTAANRAYQVTLRAPQPNDTLNVRWTQNTSPSSSSSKVRLYGATLTKLGFSRAAAPTVADLTTDGTPAATSIDWAHWGGVTASLPASPLVPIAKAGGTEISNATQEGSGTISLATSTTLPVITANSWINGDTTPSASGIQTGIANTGGATGRGFSFTVPAAAANYKTLKLYVGAANTSTTSAQPVKLELFWGSSTIPAVVDVLPAFANATNNYVYTINLRHATAGTTLKVKWYTNTTTTTHRAILQSAVLLQN